MKVNPGGIIAPSDIVGRDQLIERLWSDLDGQSIVLTAERRIGKTCVLKKMISEYKPGYVPIYRDLESVHSVGEFVRATVSDLRPHLAPGSKLAFSGWQVLDSLKGLKTNWFTVPEHNILEVKTILQDAIQKASTNKQQRMLLFWDELPMMVDNIQKRAGENAAMEILDALRAIRQECSQVRMVFTGSIGIHHVISKLKRCGYANDATNDMATVDVPALADKDGRDLALRLLTGENIPADNPDALASEVASAACCVPFYTHHIVKGLKWKKSKIGHADVAQLVQDCITAADDPWHLGHYEQRLRTYYQQGELPTALAVLDVLSAKKKGLKPQDISKLANSRTTIDKEVFNEVLRLLELDHYLQRREDETIGFRLDLLRRWWQFKRGI